MRSLGLLPGSAEAERAAINALQDKKPSARMAAVADKSWKVRAAALEAFAQRGDPSMVPKIAAALGDSKDDVRFSAAACVAHLSELPEKEKPGGTREAVVLLRLMEAAGEFFLDTMAFHDIAYHDRTLPLGD